MTTFFKVINSHYAVVKKLKGPGTSVSLAEIYMIFFNFFNLSKSYDCGPRFSIHTQYLFSAIAISPQSRRTPRSIHPSGITPHPLPPLCSLFVSQIIFSARPIVATSPLDSWRVPIEDKVCVSEIAMSSKIDFAFDQYVI